VKASVFAGRTTPRRWLVHTYIAWTRKNLREEERDMSTEVKTLAVRMEPDQHSRLTILAKLAGQSATEIVRVAIDEKLERLAKDPEISAKAEALTAAIQQDAVDQQAAISQLFGTKPAKRSTRGSSS
jgi:predicted DNA-binding protein